MVEDLAKDFGQLLPKETKPIFTMGQYQEVNAGQGFFVIEHGHATAQKLHMPHTVSGCSLRAGRLMVWVANHIAGHSRNTYLAGTTYLDRPLYADGLGAGVLLHGGVARQGHRLSHEVGHVVGFHHVAGPPIHYTYQHSGCPAELRVEWAMMSGPSCDVNIMGEWYDGPYCCPVKGAVTSANCLKNKPKVPQGTFCCGVGCTHKCPKERPEMTFKTPEHKDALYRILRCWLILREQPKPSPNATLLFVKVQHAVQEPAPILCEDVETELGVPVTGPCNVWAAWNPNGQGLI